MPRPHIRYHHGPTLQPDASSARWLERADSAHMLLLSTHAKAGRLVRQGLTPDVAAIRQMCFIGETRDRGATAASQGMTMARYADSLFTLRSAFTGPGCSMALKSTIYKADLQIADMDRHYYADHSLTIALHPSETNERMMVRVAAFALFAQERLEFCKGLSDIDEPDLWAKDLTGAIDTWIDVGQPDERRIAKASGRANEVIVIAYGGRTSDIWWQGVRNKVDRLRNVTVWSLGENVAAALAGLAERTMRLQCTVQDNAAWLGSETADAVP